MGTEERVESLVVLLKLLPIRFLWNNDDATATFQGHRAFCLRFRQLNLWTKSLFATSGMGSKLIFAGIQFRVDHYPNVLQALQAILQKVQKCPLLLLLVIHLSFFFLMLLSHCFAFYCCKVIWFFPNRLALIGQKLAQIWHFYFCRLALIGHTVSSMSLKQSIKHIKTSIFFCPSIRTVVLFDSRASCLYFYRWRSGLRQDVMVAQMLKSFQRQMKRAISALLYKVWYGSFMVNSYN